MTRVLAQKLRYLSLPLLVAATLSACISSSGDAPSPVSSVPLSTSEAGVAALSSGTLNPDTCQAVLGTPPDTHTLDLQALTTTAQGDNQQIDAMCSAVFETSNPGEPFLAVALMKFESDTPAIAHYELLKDAFASLNQPISEVNNADDGLLDRFSALIDKDGIGRTTVMRQRNWVLTISIGPTTTESLWTTDDLQMIGESIISRGQE